MSTSIDLKLQLLNEKCDKMIMLFESLLVKKKKKTSKESDKTEYSIKEYNGNILIKFEYNTEFKNFIKELGGVWLVGKKSWIIKESDLSKIAEKFSKWTII